MLFLNILFLNNNKSIIISLEKLNLRLRLDYIIAAILMISFAIIIGLRGENVGIDTSAYIRSYNRIANAGSIGMAISISTFSGMGYIIIAWIVSILTNSQVVFSCLCAVIICFCIYYVNKEVSVNIIFSIFIWQALGLFYFSMNGNRQSIAAALFVVSYKFFLIDKKVLKSLIVAIIAVSIHPTSVILLSFILSKLVCEKIISEKRLCLISLVGGVIGGYLFKYGVLLVVKIFPDYQKYITGEGQKIGIFEETGGGRIVLLYIILLLVVVMGIFALKNKKQFISYKLIPMILFFLGLAIVNSRNVYVSRTINYIFYPLTFILPNILDGLSDKKIKFILKITLIIILFMFNILLLIENKNGIVPYEFC